MFPRLTTLATDISRLRRSNSSSLLPISSFTLSSMRRSLLRAESGVGAHAQFRELFFGVRLATQECTNERTDEAERDAHESGIFEREDGRPLNQVTCRARHGRRINRHQAGAD